jgi:biopolymer transport protein TolR
VVIAGDKKVRYEAVLKVMDDLQQQQVKRIGLLVQPTGK